jgi:Dolichyl-phosphate-mannose-protein mannosyltransferase
MTYMFKLSETNYISVKSRERYLLLLIVIINLIIKVIPAGILELGNDEVYYWTYALFPDWSHFDHPPMVGFTIQLFSLNLRLENEIFMRLGSLVLSSASIILLFYLVKKIYSQRAAFIAILLFTASFYFNIICGLFILPDTPQIFFILLALYFGLPSIIVKNPGKENSCNILLFGLFTGLAFLSKYHSLFLWAGFGLYVLFHNRVWLRKPSFYISALITLILMTPVFYWNMKNNFIGFTFHEKRVDLLHSRINISAFLQFNAGQFFYQNPVLSVVFILALVAVFRRKWDKIMDSEWLLIYLSLPLILIFTLLSVFKGILPHWTGPAFICLIILSSEWLSVLYEKRRNPVFNTILIANLLFILTVTAGTIQTRFGMILPADKNSDPKEIGRKDFTLDMYGWRQAKAKFSQFLQREKEKSRDNKKIKIISNKWFPAAHLDFYIAHPLNIDLIVLGNIEAAHKYYWINKFRHISPDDKVYFINSSQHYFPAEGFSDFFTGIIPRDTIHIKRNGMTVNNLFIFEMTGFKTDSIPEIR